MTTQQIKQLHQTLHKIKHLKRAGWLVKKVETPESVADHSLGLAVLALAFGVNSDLNIEKLLIMAVLHDIGESVIGDITPHDGVTKGDKQKQESAAVKDILSNVDATGELYEVWLDFEYRRTAEGKFIAQLDKLEAYLQAGSYGLNEAGMTEFGASTRAALSDPKLTAILDELEKEGAYTA